VSIGGEQFRSNGVRIFVTNLAPVIDSVKISSTTYKIDDTLRYSVKTSDSVPTFLIRIFSHDFDKNALSCSWSGAGARLIPAIGALNATYTIPQFNCSDTVRAEVYDGHGGAETRVMIISTKKNANRAPVIDSISAKDTLFTGSADVYYYSSAKLDSVKFKVSAHDSDLGDGMFYQWTNKNAKQTVLRSAGTNATFVWACTSATCKGASTALTVIDTVTVSVRDNDSATSAKTIVIVKGAIGPNKPPVFDSLIVKDTLLKGVWSIVTYQATVRDTIGFRMYAHDPDSLDTIHLSVVAQDTQRLKKLGDTAAVYACKDSIYRDTVLFHLYDLHLGYVDKKVVIDVSNRYPVIDSVRCGDTLFKAKDSLYVRKAAGGDTLAVRIFARDLDLGDVMTDTALSASGADVAKLAAMQYRYICPDSTFSDTLSAVVRDAKLKPTRKNIKIDITKK
jgi:hypothetical protein